MIVQWIGAIMIVLACGGCGIAIAVAYRREGDILRLLLHTLERMQCELSCRCGTLSSVFRSASDQLNGKLKYVFVTMADELEKRVTPDAQCCMEIALQTCSLPNCVHQVMLQLGRSLGDFDLSGQLRQFESVQGECRRLLDEHMHNREQRLYNYQVLGLCVGFALVIILI